MKRQEVDSSVLKSVGYDRDKKILETGLMNGTLYEYYGIPAAEYENLMAATSLGEYYNSHIKKYAYKKLK